MSKTPLAGRPPFEIDDAHVIYSTPAQPVQPIVSRGRYEVPQDRPDSSYRPYSPPSANQKDDQAAPPYSLTVPPSHQRTESADSAADAIGGGFLNERESFYSTATDDDYGAPKQPPQTQTQASEPDSAKSARTRPVLEKIRTDVGEAEDMRSRGHPNEQLNPARSPYDGQRPRGSPSPPAAPVNIPIQSRAAPQPQRPQPAFMGPPNTGGGYGPMNPGYMSPNPTLYSPGGISPGGMSPAIIPPSSTPIQVAFAKPIKPAFIKFDDSSDGHEGSVMSHESHMPIMRGNKEETLLTRSANGRIPRVGAKRDGDDFWRRFSMVAKQEHSAPAKEKKSVWLQSALRGRSSYQRWVWFAFFVFICMLGGGGFAIYWFTRNNQAHSVPVAIGGSAENTLSETAAAAAATAKTTNNRPLLTTSADVAKRWPAPTPSPGFSNGSIVDGVHISGERRSFQGPEEYPDLHQRGAHSKHHRRARGYQRR